MEQGPTDNIQQPADIFNKHALKYQERFMDVQLYSESLDFFCDHIGKENARILELACGPGNITRYLLNKRPDLKIMATDLAPNMLQLAAQNNPEAEFRLMDCREISGLEVQYDAIMCGFCLPYLSETEAGKLISDAAQLLPEGGLLYISTMEENDTNKSGIRTSSAGDKMYMYYHKAVHLTKCMAASNLTIDSISRKEYPSSDGTTTTDLIIIARKGRG